MLFRRYFSNNHSALFHVREKVPRLKLILLLDPKKMTSMESTINNDDCFVFIVQLDRIRCAFYFEFDTRFLRYVFANILIRFVKRTLLQKLIL